jgi:hypothetical protein
MTTTMHSTVPAHQRPGGRPHPTETGVAPVLPQQDPLSPADDSGIQADTHVQINGELASRLMRSSRWQQ